MVQAQPSLDRLLKALTAPQAPPHGHRWGPQPRVRGSPLHSGIFAEQDPTVGELAPPRPSGNLLRGQSRPAASAGLGTTMGAAVAARE